MMKLWNVFRMEIFKNLQDRTNLFIMLVLMCLNIVGGIAIQNHHWRNPAGPLITLGYFSMFCSAIFLFVYPYRLAQVDYKNKVMSLMIASGVSRVQYFFVKAGATLLFSFISVVVLALIPTLIVTNVSLGDLYLSWAGFWIALTAWLSTFFTLMTAVIIARGKGKTIFIFFGLNFVMTFVMGFGSDLILPTVVTNTSYNSFLAGTIIINLITMAIMALIGILVLRKQDL